MYDVPAQPLAGCEKETTQEERAISVEIIAYLYERAKDGDGKAFQLFQKIFNS